MHNVHFFDKRNKNVNLDLVGHYPSYNFPKATGGPRPPPPPRAAKKKKTNKKNQKLTTNKKKQIKNIQHKKAQNKDHKISREIVIYK